MTIESLWFWLLAFLVVAYVVLDGFDLGVGILHLFVARTHAQRDVVIRSIGPVWDANEVWLIAAGGTMLLAFPLLLATALSGFYLPFMIMLWLLVFRALAIELRHQLHDPIWHQLWDVAFFASSLLLAVVIGVAVANVFRGVPIDENGSFFEPLWTDFRVGEHTGIFDWFTILVGVTSACALAHHGARWLIYRTDADVRDRAARVATPAFVATLLLTLAVMAAGPIVQPKASTSLTDNVAAVALSILSIAALVASASLRRRPGLAFLASCLYLAATLGAGAAMLYPDLLPARDPAHSLTVSAAAAPNISLRVALTWWIPGMLLVIAYQTIIYRTLPKTISESTPPPPPT